MNFKEFVDKADEIWKILQERHLTTLNPFYKPENWKVKILTIPKAGYFGTFSVPLDNMSVGIDWDDGCILLSSKEPLYDKLPDRTVENMIREKNLEYFLKMDADNAIRMLFRHCCELTDKLEKEENDG